MSDREPHDGPVASWTQLETAVERLHAAARAGLEAREFYRRLLAEAGAAIGAVGGAAWHVRPGGTPELVFELRENEVELANRATRREWVTRSAVGGEPEIHAGGSRADDSLVAPVMAPGLADEASGRTVVAAFELWLPAGASPLVQQGWLEFAATLADVASDFHALDELGRLREGAALNRQAVDFLRRVQAPRDLKGAAFEIANEGRRLLGCDRVNVLVRRGGRWRLLSTSGAIRIERRTDFARRTERLAEQIAKWSDPLFYPAEEADEHLPPTVLAAVEQHVDHSHAREVACVPITFRRSESAADDDSRTSGRPRHERIDAVLVAERFDADASPGWQRHLIELGELCAPALERAAALDRIPIRPLLGLSERFEEAALQRRLVKSVAIVGGLVAAVAALAFVPADFDVEASGTLKAAVEREVFASATGSIAEVRVVHGQMVKKDDVLIVLSDPELALKLQQVRGELEATRKRLDALAVTRTERTLREAQPSDDRLPLAAEQRQLEERLSSLESQRELLERRRAALTLQSPIGGQVLTRDVQSLLASRPVERGQALMTVADVSSGWELVADVPQRQIGHVLEAQQETGDIHLAASQRLAGDVRTTYPGHVIEVAAAAPLEPEGLENEAPPVKVRIALDGEAPAAARPGMTAAVQIHCGRRPLGYVWLHDVGATIYRWMTF